MYEKFSKKPLKLKELFSILNKAYVFENQEVKPHRATGNPVDFLHSDLV